VHLDHALLAVELPSGRLRHTPCVPPLLPQRRIAPAAATFCATSATLVAALGEEEAARRAAQVQHACLALRILQTHDGTFPFRYRGEDIARAQHVQLSGGDSAAGGELVVCEDPRITVPSAPLSGAECFGILSRALCAKRRSDSRAGDGSGGADAAGASRPHADGEGWPDEPLSLWSVWSFVSVLDWQLRELDAPSSSVNASLLPDASADVEYDGHLKSQMKGALVRFLEATAVEFASRRNQRVADGAGATLEGHDFGSVSYGESVWYNSVWELASFTHGGKPVFIKRQRGLYLYWRPAEKRWVISFEISHRGSVHSASNNPTPERGWRTHRDWEVDELITVVEVHSEIRTRNLLIPRAQPDQEVGTPLLAAGAPPRRVRRRGDAGLRLPRHWWTHAHYLRKRPLSAAAAARPDRRPAALRAADAVAQRARWQEATFVLQHEHAQVADLARVQRLGRRVRRQRDRHMRCPLVPPWPAGRGAGRFHLDDRARCGSHSPRGSGRRRRGCRRG
jgi:hypothetical protein